MTQLASTLLSIISRVFSLDAVYVMTGIVLWIFSLLSFRDLMNQRRVRTGLFWLILGTIFVFARSAAPNDTGVLPNWLTGLLVLVMVAIDGTGGVSRGHYNESTKEEQIGHARRLGTEFSCLSWRSQS